MLHEESQVFPSLQDRRPLLFPIKITADLDGHLVE